MYPDVKRRTKTVETSSTTLGVETEVLEILEAPTCQHQWIIESPHGPSSTGECRICGEEREFQNYIEGSAWGYDSSSELGGGSRLPTKNEMQGGNSVDGEE